MTIQQRLVDCPRPGCQLQVLMFNQQWHYRPLDEGGFRLEADHDMQPVTPPLYLDEVLDSWLTLP